MISYYSYEFFTVPFNLNLCMLYSWLGVYSNHTPEKKRESLCFYVFVWRGAFHHYRSYKFGCQGLKFKYIRLINEISSTQTNYGVKVKIKGHIRNLYQWRVTFKAFYYTMKGDTIENFCADSSRGRHIATRQISGCELVFYPKTHPFLFE